MNLQSVGYARGSASSQLFNHHIPTLNNTGCIRISADKQSGKITGHPNSTPAATSCVRDTLVLPALTRSPTHCSLVEVDVFDRGELINTYVDAPRSSPTSRPGGSRRTRVQQCPHQAMDWP
jgi:hypothetical protein